MDKSEDKLLEAYLEEIRNKASRVNVRLIDFDPDADVKLASQIIFTSVKSGLSKEDIVRWARKVKEKELKENRKLLFSPKLTSIVINSLPERSAPGLNRRHKLPRAFEHVYAEIEFSEDYGVYKDLQRNRLSSTERGFYLAEAVKIPEEYKDEGMKKVLNSYLKLFEMTKSLQKKLLKSDNPELQNCAEYIMLHGNLVRFNVKANLRQWVFFSELRTIEGGHPSYRIALQKAVKLILEKYPFMKTLFTHVNWAEDVGFGRLRAEIKTQEKLSKIVDTRT